MDIITPLNEDEKKINLAGFPPIFIISNEAKKKREFAKKYENIDTPTKSSNLNILNIGNILNIKK